MGPTERTRWVLDSPLSAEAVIDALVDFSPRLGSFMVLFGPRILRSQFRVAMGRVARGA